MGTDANCQQGGLELMYSTHFTRRQHLICFFFGEAGSGLFLLAQFAGFIFFFHDELFNAMIYGFGPSEEELWLPLQHRPPDFIQSRKSTQNLAAA